MRDRNRRDRDGRNQERPPLPRGDEPARQEDRGRDSGQLDRIRDAGEIRHRAGLSRQKERDHPGWGHAFREHVDVTDQELQRRAATGTNARGHQDGFIPEHATRWPSEAVCVIAADRIWHTPEARQQRRDIDAKIRAGQRQSRVSMDGRLFPRCSVPAGAMMSTVVRVHLVASSPASGARTVRLLPFSASKPMVGGTCTRAIQRSSRPVENEEVVNAE